MGDLSKNFSQSEWRCKCGSCKDLRPDQAIVFLLQMLRSYLSGLFGEGNIRVKITSGIRCRLWNRHEKGSKESRHIYLIAADIKVYYSAKTVNGRKHWTKLKPDYIYRLFNEWFPDTLGLGLYKTFCHIDAREIKGRWRG